MNTTRFAIKCMACALHYNVYSWSTDWNLSHDAYCPECGEQRSFLLGTELLDKEIFQLVPGPTDNMKAKDD